MSVPSERLLPLPRQQAELSSACLVLVDLVGSTRLAHSLPIEHYMALMTEFIQVMILSFEARGGHVLQHQGDAVLGYWPMTDADQACAAALETHERAARIGLADMLGVKLKVRVGIAGGQVTVGVVGGQLSAYGLPVNYARRLCDAAHAGQTLACAQIGGLTLFDMQMNVHPPLDLQGFGTACCAYEVSSAAHPPAHMKVD